MEFGEYFVMYVRSALICGAFSLGLSIVIIIGIVISQRIEKQKRWK